MCTSSDEAQLAQSVARNANHESVVEPRRQSARSLYLYIVWAVLAPESRRIPSLDTPAARDGEEGAAHHQDVNVKERAPLVPPPPKMSSAQR